MEGRRAIIGILSPAYSFRAGDNERWTGRTTGGIAALPYRRNQYRYRNGEGMTNDQPDWIIPEQPSSRVIISAGIGSYHYRKMLRSTENHCAVHCTDTTRMFFDVLPTGARTHIEDPYGFKIHALKRHTDPGDRSEE